MTKRDYEIITDASGIISGIWVRDPNKARNPSLLRTIASKSFGFGPAFWRVTSGSYRIIDYEHEDVGGCFVIFDPPVKDHVRTPINQPTSTALHQTLEALRSQIDERKQAAKNKKIIDSQNREEVSSPFGTSESRPEETANDRLMTCGMCKKTLNGTKAKSHYCYECHLKLVELAHSFNQFFASAEYAYLRTVESLIQTYDLPVSWFGYLTQINETNDSVRSSGEKVRYKLKMILSDHPGIDKDTYSILQDELALWKEAPKRIKAQKKVVESPRWDEASLILEKAFESGMCRNCRGTGKAGFGYFCYECNGTGFR